MGRGGGEGEGGELRRGQPAAELKLTADMVLHPPLLPQGGVEARAGELACLDEARVYRSLYHREGIQALNLATSKEASLLLARATWILGPIS